MLDDLSADHVRSIFFYDPSEGLLRWRHSAGQGGRIPPGTIAGRMHPEGYRYVTVNGRHYRVSRIVWLYQTGEWPRLKIDHKDCDPTNDKWNNLREATDSQQKQNNRKRRDNKTGFKCVVFDKSRNQYRWQVVVNGKRIKGKRFGTAAEAFADYQSRLPTFHGDFANDGVT